MDKVTRLTTEQEAVRNLPIDGWFVVTGPPGTGKSLLAVLRASKILASGQPLLLLSKNVPLNCHLRESIAPALAGIESISDFVGDAETFIRTYDSFTSKLWWKVPKAVGIQYPGKYKKGPMLPGDENYGYDWVTATNDVLAKLDPEEARNLLGVPKNILVDEGQDLPSGFFRFITMMDCNVTVFADENQMIRPNMSKIEDIREAMYITLDKGFEYQVKKNWRNTKQTAEIAGHFYVGLETGIPELPDKVGPKPSVVGFDNLHNLAEVIVSLAQRKRGAAVGSGPSVGVVVFASDPRLKELDLTLRQVAEQKSEVEDQIDIRRYDREGFKDEPFVFDTPESVTIVTPLTMKGLEWDNVVVVLDNLVLKDSPEQKIVQLMQCYVAASRPRNRLLIAWTGKVNNGSHVPPIAISGLLKKPYDEKIEKEWKNGK
jgi:hypothetical protein